LNSNLSHKYLAIFCLLFISCNESIKNSDSLTGTWEWYRDINDLNIQVNEGLRIKFTDEFNIMMSYDEIDVPPVTYIIKSIGRQNGIESGEIVVAKNEIIEMNMIYKIVKDTLMIEIDGENLTGSTQLLRKY